MRIFYWFLGVAWVVLPKVTETHEQGFARSPTDVQAEGHEIQQPIQTQESDNFNDYRALAAKVLYTRDEQIQIRTMLSDSRLLWRAFLDLMDPKSQDDVRFEKLDFLEKALAWAENPAREEVVDFLKEALLVDNINGLKSIAGDKIEIYMILREFAPEALESIERLPKEGHIQKLIAYAKNLTGP